MDQLLKATLDLVSILPSKKMSYDSPPPVRSGLGCFAKNMAGCHAVRVAGISGALAVIMGAYGAHAFTKKYNDDEAKLAYETANRYHLIHSVALLAVPLTNRPHLVGGLLLGGMFIFSGSLYYYALTDTKVARKVTPIGGVMLITAWLSMVL